MSYYLSYEPSYLSLPSSYFLFGFAYLRNSSKDHENKLPFSGSIDEIGNDIQRLKDMGVDHIIFAYNFVPIGRARI
jgi:hypothetical protein